MPRVEEMKMTLASSDDLIVVISCALSNMDERLSSTGPFTLKILFKVYILKHKHMVRKQILRLFIIFWLPGVVFCKHNC